MEQTLTWVGENKELLILGGLLVCVFFICVSPLYFFRPKRVVSTVSGETMKITRADYERQDHERRVKERQLVVDGFEDMILDLLSKGSISESRYKYWHGKLALAADAADYINQNLSSSPKALKEALRRRRNGGNYHFFYQKVNIPGPKPGEKEVFKPRNELEALILSLQTR